ncbi:hypothetical protein [Sporolactobacillus terrae]|uniref:Uncharacterized protein n=1 Tax=Sporolactobacillus terrae TaxID=269673 RepID=A0A5K7WUQ5_9BACL|nr:hypothetical protein [Sporolactobacillus terrae]UAK16773.1 hypothetical protein K7399_02060 [Sporolactobacillus terrae]BBN98255.1 hypothetical protein St703_09600 [Sporolactobacillus terrae]
MLNEKEVRGAGIIFNYLKKIQEPLIEMLGRQRDRALLMRAAAAIKRHRSLFDQV